MQRGNKKQEAQLPQRDHASNIALPYGAKGILICWTRSSQWITKCKTIYVAHVPVDNALVLREYRHK